MARLIANEGSNRVIKWCVLFGLPHNCSHSAANELNGGGNNTGMVKVAGEGPTKWREKNQQQARA